MSQLLNNLAFDLVFPPGPVLEDDFNAPNFAAFTDNFAQPPGAVVFNDTFDDKNLTKFEDNFDRVDPAPWVSNSAGSLSIVSGQLTNTNITGSPSQLQARLFDAPFVDGKWYRIRALRVSGEAQSRLETFNDAGAPDQVSENILGENAQHDWTIQASANTQRLYLIDANQQAGTNSVWDNVLIEEVPALDGWSVVNGTLSIVNGRLRLESTSDVSPGSASKAVTIPAGFKVLSTADMLNQGPGTTRNFRVGSTAFGADIADGQETIGVSESVGYDISGDASAFTTIHVGFFNNSLTIGDTSDWDNIQVQLGGSIAPWSDTSTGNGSVTVEDNQLRFDSNAGAASARYQKTDFGGPTWVTVRAKHGGGDALQFFAGTTGIGSSDLFISALGSGQENVQGPLYLPTGEIYQTIATSAPGETAFVDSYILEEVPALEGWVSHNEAVVEISSGALSVTSNGTLQGTAYKQIDSLLTVGKTYIASAFIDTTDGSFGGAALQVGSLPGASDITPGTSVSYGNAETVYASFTAPTGDVLLRCLNATGTAFARLFDNITLQESLLENPTFDSDTAGWTGANSAVLSSVSGKLDVENGAANFGYAFQSFATVVGARYSITGSFERVDSLGILRVGTTQNGSQILDYGMASSEDFSQSFIATATTTFIGLWNNNSTAGVNNRWDNVIVIMEETGVVGTGRLPIKNDTTVPDEVKCGIPFDDGAVAIDSTGPIDHYHQGLPYTAAGRLATATDAAVDRVGSGAAPLTVEGRLALGTGALGQTQFGVPYTTGGQIAV